MDEVLEKGTLTRDQIDQMVNDYFHSDSNDEAKLLLHEDPFDVAYDLLELPQANRRNVFDAKKDTYRNVVRSVDEGFHLGHEEQNTLFIGKE